NPSQYGSRVPAQGRRRSRRADAAHRRLARIREWSHGLRQDGGTACGFDADNPSPLFTFFEFSAAAKQRARPWRAHRGSSARMVESFSRGNRDYQRTESAHMTDSSESILNPELRSWIGRNGRPAQLETMSASD